MCEKKCHQKVACFYFYFFEVKSIIKNYDIRDTLKTDKYISTLIFERKKFIKREGYGFSFVFFFSLGEIRVHRKRCIV